MGRGKRVEFLYTIEVTLLPAPVCCNYKMFYVSPMVTTKKMPTEDKIRNKSKYINIKKSKKYKGGLQER